MLVSSFYLISSYLISFTPLIPSFTHLIPYIGLSTAAWNVDNDLIGQTLLNLATTQGKIYILSVHVDGGYLIVDDVYVDPPDHINTPLLVATAQIEEATIAQDVDLPTTSTSSSSSFNIILIASIIGGIVGLTTLMIGMIYWYQRKHQTTTVITTQRMKRDSIVESHEHGWIPNPALVAVAQAHSPRVVPGVPVDVDASNNV